MTESVKPAKRITFKVLVLAVALALGLAACQDDDAAEAEIDAAEHFSGESVEFVVPAGGGGFDWVARAISPHLEDILDTTIANENRPGAGGVVGMNYVMQEEADGRSWVIWQLGSLAAAQLTEQEGVQFDLNETTYLANLAGADYLWVVGADTGYETYEDVLAAGEFSFAATGVGAANYNTAHIMGTLLDLDYSVAAAYDGTAEAEVGVISGEVDGIVGPYGTFAASIEAGDIVPIMRLATEPAEDFPDLPTHEDLDLTDDEAEVLATHIELLDMFRVVMAPPGVPDEVVAHLRDAFEEAASDDELAADAAEQGQDWTFTHGDDVEARVPDLLDPPQEYLDLLEELVAE